MRSFSQLTHRGQFARLKVMAEVAVKAWPCASPQVKPIHYGENATFRVEDATGSRYLLRIARPGYHSLGQIQSELLFLKTLLRAGLEVPDPVAGRNGQWVQGVTVPGVPETRQCLLFRWMEGRFVYDGLRLIHGKRLGQTIARLHETGHRWTPPPQFDRDRFDGQGLVGPGAVWGDPWECPLLSEADRQWVTAECARIRERLDAYGDGPDRFGLIHADLHFGNLVHHRGWPRIFDFDDLAHGFLAHDLIHCLYFAEHKEKPAFRDALLEGYASVRPLPPDLETILPLLSQAFRLRAISWFTTRSDTPRVRRLSIEGIPKQLAKAREKALDIK